MINLSESELEFPRNHRNQFRQRPSTATTATLPEYDYDDDQENSSAEPHPAQGSQPVEGLPYGDDRPPDYPYAYPQTYPYNSNVQQQPDHTNTASDIHSARLPFPNQSSVAFASRSALNAHIPGLPNSISSSALHLGAPGPKLGASSAFTSNSRKRNKPSAAPRYGYGYPTPTSARSSHFPSAASPIDPNVYVGSENDSPEDESSDPFLDALLERSVHALEMSNALLLSTKETGDSVRAIGRDDDDDSSFRAGPGMSTRNDNRNFSSSSSHLTAHPNSSRIRMRQEQVEHEHDSEYGQYATHRHQPFYEDRRPYGPVPLTAPYDDRRPYASSSWHRRDRAYDGGYEDNYSRRPPEFPPYASSPHLGHYSGRAYNSSNSPRPSPRLNQPYEYNSSPPPTQSRLSSSPRLPRQRQMSTRSQMWARDLDELTKGVEGLFSEEEEQVYSGSEDNSEDRFVNPRRTHRYRTDSLSSSLPSTVPKMGADSETRRKPSLDFESGPSKGTRHSRSYSNSGSTYRSGKTTNKSAGGSGLQLSTDADTTSARQRLVAPPPRALTQYVASNVVYSPIASEETHNNSRDNDAIVLPSTLGVRGAGGTHSLGKTAAASVSLALASRGSTSKGKASVKSPTNQAYNMLAAFMTPKPNEGNNSPSPSRNSSRGGGTRTQSRNTNTTRIPSNSTRQSGGDAPFDASRRVSRTQKRKSTDLSIRTSRSPHAAIAAPTHNSQPFTNSSSPEFDSLAVPVHPRRSSSLPHSSHSSRNSDSGSSSSSHGCRAKLTVKELRRILDLQAQAQHSQQAANNTASVLTSSMTHSASLNRVNASAMESSSSLSSTTSTTSTMTAKPVFSNNSSMQTQKSRHVLRPRPKPRALKPFPAPAVEATTSTATASVSKLLTKNIHSHSSNANGTSGSASPRSAMKKSGSSTPVPSSPDTPFVTPPTHASRSTFAAGLALALSLRSFVLPTNSNPILPLTVDSPLNSSGTSTPRSGHSKKISFAALPESYSAENGSQGVIGARRAGARSRKKGKGTSRRSHSASGSDEVVSSWWLSWLGTGAVGGAGSGLSTAHGGLGMSGASRRGFGEGVGEWGV